MSGYLLDVNVLLALVREDHIAHKTIRRWFHEAGGKRWSSCALTQAGFVRVITNPRFLEDPPHMEEALDMLRALTALPGHRYWPIELPFAEAVQPFEERLFGHQQVTDAYLLGLAIKNHGKLVTLDTGIEALAGKEFSHHVEMIG